MRVKALFTFYMLRNVYWLACPLELLLLLRSFGVFMLSTHTLRFYAFQHMRTVSTKRWAGRKEFKGNKRVEIWEINKKEKKKSKIFKPAKTQLRIKKLRNLLTGFSRGSVKKWKIRCVLVFPKFLNYDWSFSAWPQETSIYNFPSDEHRKLQDCFKTMNLK